MTRMSEHSDVPAILRSRRDVGTPRPAAPRTRRSGFAPVVRAGLSGLVVVLAATALAALPPAASAYAGPATSSAVPQHAVAHLDLHGDTDAVAPAGARTAVPTWRGRTLTYYETLPTKWAWSLDGAVAKWNASGGRIRLVPTKVRSKAQVTIGYGSTSGAAGLATVGRTRNAWVHLSPTYDTVDALDPWYRVEVLGVLAHELGHVLGFQHTTTPCSLMSPVLDVVACGMFSPDTPGYYRCRTIDPALAARFVRTYGGRARLAPTSPCLIDPMPSALQPTYRLDTSSGSPGVDVDWTLPAVVPAGSQVEIRHWSAVDCTLPPVSPSLDRTAPSALTWNDAAAADAEDTCYQAVLANRYGVSRSAASVLMRPTVAAAMREQLAATPDPEPAPAS